MLELWALRALFAAGLAAGSLRAAFATRSAWSGVGATLRAAFSATTLRAGVGTALRTSLPPTFRTSSGSALATARETLALRAGGTKFVFGDFAVAVLIEFLEGFGSFREFVRVDGSVLVCVESFDDRAHRTKSLAAGATGEALSGAAFSTWLPFAAGTTLAPWLALARRTFATRLISARLISTRTVTARLVSLRALACGTISARRTRRRVLCDGEVA